MSYMVSAYCLLLVTNVAYLLLWSEIRWPEIRHAMTSVLFLRNRNRDLTYFMLALCNII